MYKFQKAVVIGSGTMGAAIAAHFANAGARVTLLDIVPGELTTEESKRGLTLESPEVRNRIVRSGFDRALKSRPASFFSPALADAVSLGNLEDDLAVVGDADWVVEVIVENLRIKRELMTRIDALRGPHTIVSTNTSGIPIAQIVEGRSDSFRQHFLGTHFFNPPRYLKLLEIIPGAETLPEVLRFITAVGEGRLGKGVVLCKDTPNFIGNRLGSVGGAFAVDFILKNQYTVKEVDTITGPLIGRPKTATFRLLDLVGIDVWDHVGSNLARAIPHDSEALQYLNAEAPNQLLRSMIAKGYLGNKVESGFYKTVKGPEGKEFWELNLQTLEHEPPVKVRFESVGKVMNEPDLAKRLKFMLSADDRAGDLVRALIYQSLAYASYVIPEIADTPRPIDDAMRWGFGHDVGPFEIWDLLGVAETAEKMQQAGFSFAPWVSEMFTLGFTHFYKNGKAYNPAKKDYEPGMAAPLVQLKAQKDAGKVIAKNPSASLIDLGDGVACVEFHTKMNVIDADIAQMIATGLKRTAQDFEGLVIGNEAENFSAGANLFLVVMNAQAGQWQVLDDMVKGLQDLHMQMRYFHKPVVVAPAGLALGGGSENIMHASRVVSAAELYAGLVELGAGVIPAGGGTKEMLRRNINPAMRVTNADVLPFMQKTFEQIGQAKVATSAVEAREFGILGPCDRIVLHRDHLLQEAKREVLAMAAAGYTAPLPEKVYAAGRDVLAALRVAIFMFREGNYISDYDVQIANKLAYVMTGGDLSQPAWLSEQYFLDLEREAFLSLCGEEKTRQRMWSILNTGKPLRN